MIEFWKKNAYDREWGIPSQNGGFELYCRWFGMEEAMRTLNYFPFYSLNFVHFIPTKHNVSSEMIISIKASIKQFGKSTKLHYQKSSSALIINYIH